jgi:hypothetical protein
MPDIEGPPTPPEAVVHRRVTPERMRPAQIAAKALNSRHRIFADLVLSGMPAGRAYERISKSRGNTADTCAAELVRRPRVVSYMAAVRDQSVANVVLSQEVLHGHAMAIARGGDDIGPQMQMEAIQYLDRCLNRNRTINIEGLTLQLDASEAHVAALAYAALEGEARGSIPAEDARHLIESAAMVQQIMHGRTIARDMAGEGSEPAQPLPRIAPPEGTLTNGHGAHPNGSSSNGGSHTASVTLPDPAQQPVRPKWLKTPEAIAAAAKARAAAKKPRKDS